MTSPTHPTPPTHTHTRTRTYSHDIKMAVVKLYGLCIRISIRCVDVQLDLPISSSLSFSQFRWSSCSYDNRSPIRMCVHSVTRPGDCSVPVTVAKQYFSAHCSDRIGHRPVLASRPALRHRLAAVSQKLQGSYLFLA